MDDQRIYRGESSDAQHEQQGGEKTTKTRREGRKGGETAVEEGHTRTGRGRSERGLNGGKEGRQNRARRIERREGLTRRDQPRDSCLSCVSSQRRRHREGRGRRRRTTKEEEEEEKKRKVDRWRREARTRSNDSANGENKRDREHRGETSAAVVDSCVCAE